MTDKELNGLKKGDRIKIFYAFCARPHTEIVSVVEVSKFCPNGDVDGTPWVYYERDNGTHGAICGTFVTKIIE